MGLINTIITSCSLLLVIIGWYVTGKQNRDSQKRLQLVQYCETLKLLSKEDMIQFLDNPINAQRLILLNKAEIEKRILILFFSQDPLREKLSDKFDSLIVHLEERSQQLMKKNMQPEERENKEEELLVEGNLIIIDIIELISSTKKVKISTNIQP